MGVIIVIIFWRSEDILKRSPQDQGIYTLKSLSSTSKPQMAEVRSWVQHQQLLCGLFLILAKPPPAHGHIQRTRKKRKIIKQADYHDSKAHPLWFSSLPFQVCRDKLLLQNLLVKSMRNRGS
jgi:hypothetical protein